MSVTIGIDPHEATPTAVAIDRDDQPIAKLGVVAERCQSERLLAGAASFGFAPAPSTSNAHRPKASQTTKPSAP